jgi:hypothetical protein
MYHIFKKVFSFTKATNDSLCHYSGSAFYRSKKLLTAFVKNPLCIVDNIIFSGKGNKSIKSNMKSADPIRKHFDT